MEDAVKQYTEQFIALNAFPKKKIVNKQVFNTKKLLKQGNKVIQVRGRKRTSQVAQL